MIGRLQSFSIVRIETYVFRAPIDIPIQTSFGLMNDRPAIFLRLEDADGAHGWGEVWCNFPVCGAEHRAHLLDRVLAPLLLGRILEHPSEAFEFLTRRTKILGLQTGEPGPLAQCIAGLDIALWDLVARKMRLPMCNLLGGETAKAVPAYASGINPGNAVKTVAEARNAGYRAFKLKIGFSTESDKANIGEVVSGLFPGEVLMLDANQAWQLNEAEAFVKEIESLPIQWLEEPIPADRPAKEWAQLSSASPIPLAGGENLRCRGRFEAVIQAGSLSVVQPDVCKWGGITGCLQVGRSVLRGGLRYCPHYLGGGIGLLASAHLLAAVGGDGMLEVDFNPNPLRGCLVSSSSVLSNGLFPLPDGAGLGVEPGLEAVKSYLTLYTAAPATL